MDNFIEWFNDNYSVADTEDSLFEFGLRVWQGAIEAAKELCDDKCIKNLDMLIPTEEEIENYNE